MVFKMGYLNNGRYNQLRINLILLYLLNLSDLFFTKFLLTIEPTMFKEVNIFLAPIIDGGAPYFLKIVVIGVVLYYWYFRSRESNEKEIGRSLIAGRGLLILYMAINVLHLFNFGLLIYLK